MRRFIRASVAGLLFAGVALTFGAPSANAAAANPWPHTVVNGFSTPSGSGFWLVNADGSVATVGDAHSYGDASGLALNGPIVGGAVGPGGAGY